ncbi:hypothetical protein [Cryptosporangium sp. NPDC048952]
MFIVLLLVAMAAVVGAMLTALPRMEGRLVEDLGPAPVEASAPTGTP